MISGDITGPARPTPVPGSRVWENRRPPWRQNERSTLGISGLDSIVEGPDGPLVTGSSEMRLNESTSSGELDHVSVVRQSNLNLSVDEENK
jgi:hypothetical protein